MKTKITLKSIILLWALIVGSVSEAWADDPYYTLDTSASGNAGTNSAYASEGSKEVNGITWYATGNMQQQPWRIGGKASSSSTTATLDVSRTVYTATAMEEAIESIKLYIGDVTVNTFTSVVLTVSSKADFSSITDEITKSSPSASSTLTFSPTSGSSWDSGLYFKFTINATLKGKSNTYVQFSKVEFYKYTGGGSTPSITASNVNIEYNATNGSIGYQLANATGNVTASVTSGDWLTLGTVTASAVPFTCSANTGTTARTAQVTLSFTGATDKVVTVTQAAAGVANPSINVTSSSPTSFSYVVGNGPSDASTISVSGSNLTANISISLGDNSDYEMSLAANGTYTNSLTLTQSEGTVSKTTIYFRLKAGLAKGTHNGTLTLSSTGATDVVINLSGSVTGQTHAVTCVADPVAGGTIEANPTSANEGQEVTLTCTPAEGYSLSAITITKTSDGSATDIKVTNNKFTMPDFAVTATATFLSNTYEGTFAYYSGTLTEGDYLLVDDTYAMSNSLSSGKFLVSSVEISDNIITDPLRSTVWHIAPSSTTGYWTIYNAVSKKYVYAKASDTTIGFSDEIDDESLWSVNCSYDFRCKANEGKSIRYISKNSNNVSFVNYASGNGGPLTLYKYTVLTDRTITFDGNGGTYNESTTYTQNVYDGVQAKLAANKFTKTDYEFVGWNTNANGENGTAYADGANITVTGSDLTLYAQWAPLYTLTIDGNIDGGSVAVEGDVTSAIEGTEITLTSTPTAGHKFSAWNVYKAGDTSTKVTVSDENKFTMPAYNVVISATFEEVQTYTLVTDVANIVSGKHYIIASGANGDIKAMGAQSNNIRSVVSVKASNGVIPETDGVYEFVIYGPNADGYYTIYDAKYDNNNGGYLYASSGTSNYMGTQASNDANGKWSIEIANTGAATINAHGINTHDRMRFNGDRFSCYLSSTNVSALPYLYVKDGDTPVATTASVKLNAYGYATFASTSALDFLDADKAEYSAWQITGVTNSKITFGQIKSTVAAGKGVLLKGTPNATINLNILPVGGDALSTIILVGITAAKAVEANQYYGLSGNQFKKVGAGTVPAGKALLPASVVGNASRLTFVFEGETTGVQELKNSRIEGTESCYDLQGRRVVKPTKGLYIVNGKKVVIK